MKLQQLLSQTRKAIDEYQMIQDGDRIAVGISGGKDSLTLLYALSNLRRFYPKKFEIEAISVNIGFDGVDMSEIESLCRDLNVSYTIIDTEIAKIIFEERKESNPCSLCAKMRKGSFNEKAKELNCNKIAYAHHKDDVIETLFLSFIFEGRLHSFSPVTYLDRMDLTLIRPMLFVSESDVIGFKNKYNLPIVKNPCPADGYTKREYAKNLVKQLSDEHPGAKERMFTAILNGNLQGWPQRILTKRI
ncbi:tRNA 2-thiocytidine biosynthesis TtcA family protein [Anaerosacchariphilus polymeriproducens]|uniref:tRNA 2-thiocytidine biosynthesis protein TtcA n=1 Tax=Anaerosacchariphilus polymeriproducens TaxID=1812858 RepID=A0A371AU04_9FIRM|nr:tRNA 2-thiocytidine biosynthesis TtcA family protein [Anaerosacchariphilus polymeriproducens]RDU23046.1 tRNA 2-thiocytidine biosynthesis protein TtcA [Anaerosacchariphilus polymeriproducens]